MPVKPYVNMNGTAQKDLFWANRNALDAVKNAIEKLRDSTPHSRDYATAYEAYIARKEHFDMLTQLQEMQQHFETLAESLVDF